MIVDFHRKIKGLSPRARDLICMFEQSPNRGGYHGYEITREFIHEEENIFGMKWVESKGALPWQTANITKLTT